MNATTEISIEVMTAEYLRTRFLLWRCLHGGPLRKETIDLQRKHWSCIA